MKVITGKLKGKRLKGPKDIRPVTSMIKEAIFDTLSWVDWEESFVLDLFCGAGNFGIEAISRGAKYVVFIDKSRDSANFVKKNLENIEFHGKIIVSDFRKAIKNLFKKNEKFNIIFADPPFDLLLGNEIIRCLEEHDILAQGGLLVLRIRDKEELKINDRWQSEKRKYGDSVVYYLKRI
jgi:16S rRNA (guanine966-N2)-methyltransferase